MVDWEGGENEKWIYTKKLKRVIKEFGDCGVLNQKLKEKKENLKEILTYLFGACLPFTRIDDVPLFKGEWSMTNRILPIPDLHYEMKGQAILL